MTEASRPLSIAAFTNTYIPTVNGVVNSIHTSRQGLEELGHRVYIFAPGDPDAPEDPSVFHYPSIGAFGPDDYRHAFPFSPAVIQALRRLHVDIVHTHHPWWVGRWGLQFGRRAGIPVVTTVHTQYTQYSHWVPFHQPTVKRILKGKTRDYCQEVDLVLTPGARRKCELDEMGVETPIEVVPNATDIQRFHDACGDSVRERFGLQGDQPVVLYVGRLTREKRVDVLVRAAAIVLRCIPEARVMVVGGGPDLESARDLTAELGLDRHVHFTGRVAPERVPKFCAAADVFATASLSEVQPVSLTEAMAAGTPVVAVDAHWSRDVVHPGENGLLAEDAVEDLGRQIVSLLSDRNLRERLSRGARREAERYALTPATRRLLEAYETVLARPAA